MRIGTNRLPLCLLFPLLLSLAGCGTAGVPYDTYEEEPSFRAARFTNPSDAACRQSLSAQVTSVLLKEGETSDAARRMTAGLFTDLQHQIEPGPFYALSPGGVRYGFFLQETKFGCVLRLYERRRLLGGSGPSSLDTLDYLASRTVLYCSCADPDPDTD